jgi:hypothetical protein
MEMDFLHGINTFKLQMTLDRHNVRPRLIYYVLPYPLIFRYHLPLKRKATEDEDSETDQTPLAKRPHLHDSATEKPIFRPARTPSITADHEQQGKMAI